MAKKRKTNLDLVKNLMEVSPQGALSQMFVVEAISRYCDEVIAYEIKEEDERHIINPHAWKACAEDIKKRMKEFYDSQK